MHANTSYRRKLASFGLLAFLLFIAASGFVILFLQSLSAF